MTITTTTITMPAPDRRYTPPVPSPLNPSSPTSPSGRGRRRDGNIIILGRRPGGPRSPTQRLMMRQKAAVAWRSMAQQEERRTDNNNDNHTSPREPRERASVAGAVTDSARTRVHRELLPAVVTTRTTTRTTILDEKSALAADQFFHTHHHHNASSIDVEKQQPLSYADEAILQKGGSSGGGGLVLRHSGVRLRRAGVAPAAVVALWDAEAWTLRRMAAAVALLCLAGLWSVVWMFGHYC